MIDPPTDLKIDTGNAVPALGPPRPSKLPIKAIARALQGNRESCLSTRLLLFTVTLNPNPSLEHAYLAAT